MKSETLFLKSFLKIEFFFYLDRIGNSLEQLSVALARRKALEFFQSFSFPPPKKKAFFLGGGGGNFFRIFSWILGKSLGQIWCFGIIIGLPAILWLWEIQKIWGFQYFWANLVIFFFKIRLLDQISLLEPLKMVFLTLFRSWRWFISIFNLFLSF